MRRMDAFYESTLSGESFGRKSHSTCSTRSRFAYAVVITQLQYVLLKLQLPAE